MPLDPSCVRSVLVVRLDRMGDLLCTTPMLSAIRYLFPKARLTLVVSPYTAHLVEGSPVVDEVLVYPRKKYGGTLAEKIKFLKHLKTRQFDLAFGPKARLHPTQAFLVWYSRAPLRVGRRPKPKALARRFWQGAYNVLLPQHLPGKHETEACLEMLEALGLKPPRLPSWMVLKPEYEQEIARSLQKEGLSGKPLAGVFFAKEGPRSIPWSELVKLLNKLTPLFEMNFVLCCPPGLEAEVKRACPAYPVISTPHPQHLAALLKKLKLFITPDGGQAHISAAVRTPPITLFTGGPVHRDTWYPWLYRDFSYPLQGREINERAIDFVVKRIADILRS